jgi:hypothetical protein
MKKKSLLGTLTIGLFLLLMISPASIIMAEEVVIGEDGKPIKTGEEITGGVGIIDEISFEQNYIIISDVKFLLQSDTELIDKGKKYASQKIFVPGVRVVWTAQGGSKLLSLDHYPLDAPLDEKEQEEMTKTPDATDTGVGSSEIIQGKDGVYRN